MAARVSAVVISRNEGNYLRRTVENLAATLPQNGEIVIVDDGSDDGSSAFVDKRATPRIRVVRNERPTGVARARNQGARASLGDVLVFCDAHIRVEENWHRDLTELLEDRKAGGSAPAMCQMPSRALSGYGLTLPHPNMEAKWRKRRITKPAQAAIVPGACMAVRRDVWEQTGGFDEATRDAGCVDNEYCMRLWLLGFELWITPAQMVEHRFRQVGPYYIPSKHAIHNRLRMAMVHFSPQRLDRVVGTLQKYEQFGEGLLSVMETDIAARRKELLQKRVRSDNWFFQRFGISW